MRYPNVLWLILEINPFAIGIHSNNDHGPKNHENIVHGSIPDHLPLFHATSDSFVLLVEECQKKNKSQYP
jgi:hypothetical protein